MAGKTKGKARQQSLASGGRPAGSGGSDLLNYAHAAEFLGVAEKTLQGWVERGIYAVPHVRLGRLIRFRPASLLRWLESRELNAGQFVSTPATQASLEVR